MSTAAGVLNDVTSVLFVLLAVVTGVQWLRRRDRAAGWIALTFLTLGLIVTVGRLEPAHPHGFGEHLVTRLLIELLVLFPFLLYRFAVVFDPPSRGLRLVVLAFTASLTIWTFALPTIPTTGQSWPAAFAAYVVVFVVHWALLSIVVAARLWRAGLGRPSVAANRMRMLAFAAAMMTLAIIGAASVRNTHSSAEITVQVLALLSGTAFLLGLSPPQFVRSSWRVPAQREIQMAIRELMTLATTREEVARRVLPSVVAIVGARAVAVVDGDGRTVASEGIDGPRPPDSEVLNIESPGATLVVWTSPYAPFFGDDELRLLATLAALVGIALDRVRLFEQERETRLALERANEVMTNFVALAAHELRTPVTAINGFIQTINHLGPRLSETQLGEIRLALEQQTGRLAQLVEQLLDLSRLDAAAVEVRPQRVQLRHEIEQTVRSAAQGWQSDVEVDVASPDDALVDPVVLDRIVTNLVTNAFRYGEPPVRVAVRTIDDYLRIAVEDAGPGVPPELEDTLFERFTRAGVARDRVSGTGLGLAIARAYALAHRGDLRYERVRPRGSRFVIELPSP